MRKRYSKFNGWPGATRPTDAVRKTASDQARSADDFRSGADADHTECDGTLEGRNADAVGNATSAVDLSARRYGGPSFFGVHRTRHPHRRRRRRGHAPLSPANRPNAAGDRQAEELGLHEAKRSSVEPTWNRIASGSAHSHSYRRAERAGARRFRRRFDRDPSIGSSVRNGTASHALLREAPHHGR